MKKSVLFITPYFAPQVHAAVYRIHKLAKYLPGRGWKVHVLTVGTNYLYNENPDSLKELDSSGVKIHKARFIEPTLRGVRMWIGGQDRTFKNIKESAVASVRRDHQIQSSPLRRLYQDFIRGIHNPDSYWTWKAPAIQKGVEIIRENKIPVVMTTSLPFTTIEIGSELKRRTGARWVADFRDPMCYDQRLHSSDPEIFARQREIERIAVLEADQVTTLTSAHPLILSDLYGPQHGTRARFIPTGIDSQWIPDKSNNPKKDLIFVGEYLQGYGDEFFRILDRALLHPGVKDRGIRLKIVGQEEVNRARILPMIQDLSVRNSIDFLDYRPQKEIYEMIENSLFGVICTSRHYPWWTQFAKMVDFIGLRKRVLAIVPDPSEGRKWLQKSRLGVFLDGNLEQATESLIEALHKPPAEFPAPNEEVCRLFHVENQVQEFEKIFLELIQKGESK